MAESVTNPQPARLQSLDLIRGVVMVLMAIDHVRVYSGMPAGGPTADLFFTRWVTHFCAPVFVFLAGTAAFLHGRKLGDSRKLSGYLVTRGLMLVFLELTFIRFTWTFNFEYSRFVLAGVIWMLGWCMVLLAAFVKLPAKAVGWIGLSIILFQQVFAMLPGIMPENLRNAIGWIWEFFYPAGLTQWQGMNILYVLIPWVGVMLAGYGFGEILLREPSERRRVCFRIGLGAIVLFLLAGSVIIFQGGDAGRPFIFRLLDQRKYPASQLFLLMTLGPMIALLPLVERARGWAANILATFGRVPMFYYLLHIPLIHVYALGVNLIKEGAMHSEWYASAPFAQVPPDHRWGLPLLYVVFALTVLTLYWPCLWFARIKSKGEAGWLRYL